MGNGIETGEMMSRRYKPTFEDYVRMGKQLKLLNDFMVITDVFISQSIGKTKADKICDFWSMEKKISNLRSELESMMFQAYPDRSTLDIFYGEREDLKDQIREIFK